MELLLCKEASSSFDWIQFTATLGTVAVGLAALWYANIQTTRTLDAKKLEEARQDIHQKLDEFYGPLLQLRKKSHTLYQKFSDEHRKRDPNFRTLTYLLEGRKFKGNDAVLLKEIIKIGKQCEDLIQQKAGLIDDTYLRTVVLPRATSHYLILRLAHKGLLIGDAEIYKDLTFPHELDDLLEKRKRELETQLSELSEPTH